MAAWAVGSFCFPFNCADMKGGTGTNRDNCRQAERDSIVSSICMPVKLAQPSTLTAGAEMNRRSQLRAIAIAIAAAGHLPMPAWPAGASGQRHPDVVAVKVHARGANTFDFDVTVSSPYDSAQRYADAFRVSGNDGAVYGERILLHDHATEQPFTRDLHGVAIPPGVRSVVVQARDQKHGYGGKTVALALPGR